MCIHLSIFIYKIVICPVENQCALALFDYYYYYIYVILYNMNMLHIYIYIFSFRLNALRLWRACENGSERERENNDRRKRKVTCRLNLSTRYTGVFGNFRRVGDEGVLSVSVSGKKLYFVKTHGSFSF